MSSGLLLLRIRWLPSPHDEAAEAALNADPVGQYLLDAQFAALAFGITLVSNNLREIKRVPKLRLENWV